MSLPDDETRETTTPQPEWPAADLAPAPGTTEPMPPEFAPPQAPEFDAVAEPGTDAPGEPDLEPEAVAAETQDWTPERAEGAYSAPAEPAAELAVDAAVEPTVDSFAEPSLDTPSVGNDPVAAEAIPAAPMVTAATPSEPTIDSSEPEVAGNDLAPAAGSGIASAPVEDSPTTQTQVPPIVAVPAAVVGAQQPQSWQQQPTQWQQPQQPQPPQPQQPQTPSQQPQSQWPQSQQSQWQQPQQTQQQWQQQQAQQWQQPGQYPQQQYGQQGYEQYPQQPYPQGYQQPYYPAQQGPMYSTSALVAVAGMLLALFGIVDILAGVWLLGQGNELRSFIARTTVNLFGTVIDRETMRALIAPAPGVLMVFGLIELLAGIGIFAHKGWGRAIGIVASLIGLLAMIGGISFAIALAPGASLPLIGTVAVLIGYAFILVALFAGGSHFRRRQPQR